MEELDLGALNELDRKPFKLFGTAEIMLMGGLNHNNKVVYTVDDAQECLEEVAGEGDLMELVEQMFALLEESNFFKKLQEKPQEQ